MAWGCPGCGIADAVRTDSNHIPARVQMSGTLSPTQAYHSHQRWGLLHALIHNSIHINDVSFVLILSGIRLVRP